jgi:hypothetical protein
VSQAVGFLEAKSAIHLVRVYGERKRNFAGQHSWARGNIDSTEGRDEAVIREYINNQEHEDESLDQFGRRRRPRLSVRYHPLRSTNASRGVLDSSQRRVR